MKSKITIEAADLRPGDATAAYEIVTVRKATRAEIADLWSDSPAPAKVIAARVRWIDGGEGDRFWASTERLEVTR